MIKIFFITVVLFVNLYNFAYAQFEVFLPSEKEYVTGVYFDDWIATDKNEYSGKYEYYKSEWETKVYDAFLIINSNNDNVSLELNEKINNGEMQCISGIIAINAEGFQTGSRSGSFRKLFYKDKQGNQKISYQLRFNGDCCDGACDDYFERVEIISNNKGMGKSSTKLFKGIENINIQIDSFFLSEQEIEDSRNAVHNPFGTPIKIAHTKSDSTQVIESKYSVKIEPNKKFSYRGDVFVISNETGKVILELYDRYQITDGIDEYSGIKYIDLDKDGNEELICFGLTGGNAGYMELLVFDFEVSIKPLYSIWTIGYSENFNADKLLADGGTSTDIIVCQSIGIGASKKLYYFPLRYSINSLTIHPECSDEAFLKLIETSNEELLIEINKFSKSDCKNEFIKFPFEAFYLQNKFLNNEQYSETILTKYYPCGDVSTIIENVNAEFMKFSSPKNYMFAR